MESKNGRLRITTNELANQPFVLLGAARFGQPTPPDGYLYLYVFGDSRPWETFNKGGFVQPKPVLPEGFQAVYGERPKGDADTTELRGLQTYWDQQLGLWRDNKRPDWVTDETEAKALLEWGLLGIKSFLPYRLTNGAEWVCLPDANPVARDEALPLLYQLPARLVYDLGQQGAAIYQWNLKQKGVEIPQEQQVSFFGGPRITHQG